MILKEEKFQQQKVKEGEEEKRKLTFQCDRFCYIDFRIKKTD